MTLSTAPSSDRSTLRLTGIEHARRSALQDRVNLPSGWVAPWVERSWQRCLGLGLRPDEPLAFNVLSQQHVHRTAEANQRLVQTAKPILEILGRAIVNTRYFAILTNAQGVVVDVSGQIDRSDPRAHLITRIGTDLSEQSVGTTAIGTVLAERQAVWLHRGEHFFAGTAHYSCAGAPLFGPTGACVGMLDLTGVDVPERPELQHLAALSARSIENNWVKQMTPALLLRFNWAGLSIGSESDALIGLNADGLVVCANRAARAITGLNLQSGEHAGDIFATAWQSLFDLLPQKQLEVPLWTGLQVQIQRDDSTRTSPIATRPAPMLKAIETDLIRRAMEHAKGNVAEAALRLGISRATLYRKISPQKSGDK